MSIQKIEVRISGKEMMVPALPVGNRVVIRTGKWLKLATVQDELFLEGEPVNDPETFVREIKAGKLNADVFAFSQMLTNTEPKHRYFHEWDNAAGAPTSDYKDWWENRLPQEARKNVRRAAKRGIIIKPFQCDDEMIRAIMKIYNETPIRQGAPFWHYGKDFETVKKETITFPERSEFLGAFYEGELIGFVKWLYCGPFAALMAIVSMNCHQDKRPTNALIARSVEICSEKKLSYLVYGKYIYGNKTDSPLTEFKRRNGFEQIRFPRYYVPLTLKGRVALWLRLHRGISGMLPPRLYGFLVSTRAKLVQKRKTQSEVESSTKQAEFAEKAEQDAAAA